MGDADMQLSERVGRRMKLRDLHVFMTVVQAGSMGKAAQRLNTGQPAVSRSIADLEHMLGVRLLDRDRQGVEPTPYGRAMLDCGVAVFDDLRRGREGSGVLGRSYGRASADWMQSVSGCGLRLSCR